MNENIENVKQWASDRNIIEGSTPIKQHDKLLEEVMELRDAIIKLHTLKSIQTMLLSAGHGEPAYLIEAQIELAEKEVKDAIGDSTVCLINEATMHELTLPECLDHAYNEIKDRKGMMINGTFVKESDLITTEDVISQISN